MKSNNFILIVQTLLQATFESLRAHLLEMDANAVMVRMKVQRFDVVVVLLNSRMAKRKTYTSYFMNFMKITLQQII